MPSSLATVSPPSTEGVLPHSATEAARRLAAGELTSRQLTDRLIGQIAHCNPQLRAISQPLFEQAWSDAERADRLLTSCRQRGVTPPPLCGVPITVKECFHVAGTATTLGIPTRAGGKVEADSPLVTRLRRAGAVLLGKTNVPQGLLLHCCDNPLFGRTLHPTDPQRGPGGSSGGEAAIVAAGGSLLGLASDLGGSIRQPAHACGLAGLKPTGGRLTNIGGESCLPGMQAFTLQAGPIAHCVEDLDLAMQVLTDRLAVPLQPDEQGRSWRDYRQVDLTELAIAVWPSDGWFEPAPAISYAVHNAAASLERVGCRMAGMPAQGVHEAMQLYFGLMSADGLRGVRQMLRGGKVDWQVWRQLWLARLPRAVRQAVSPLLRLGRQPNLRRLLQLSGPRSVAAYWRFTVAAEEFRRTFWLRLEQQAGHRIDALLLPPHGLPALRHGTAVDLLAAGSYCYLPNLLDAPAGVVPWSTIGPNEQIYPHGGRWDLVSHLARQTMADSAGLPIGVQVVARPWREDVVLAVMAQLERSRPENAL